MTNGTEATDDLEPQRKKRKRGRNKKNRKKSNRYRFFYSYKEVKVRRDMIDGHEVQRFCHESQ
jgi:hypothetical protein